MTQSTKVFDAQKQQSLACVDLSRKGSIDEPIRELLQYINGLDDYFSLSSCSGRICVFEEDPLSDSKKKGCRWLYTTHAECDGIQVQDALKKSEGDASFKFEPFVLHVQCCHLESAQTFHAEAVAAGFRNSGITVSKKGKIVVAVRSTHSMEVPCTHNGVLLVSTQYLAYISELANEKMTENHRRIQRLYQSLQQVEISTKATTSRDQTSRTQHAHLPPSDSHTKHVIKTHETTHRQTSDTLKQDTYDFDVTDCTMELFDTGE